MLSIIFDSRWFTSKLMAIFRFFLVFFWTFNTFFSKICFKICQNCMNYFFDWLRGLTSFVISKNGYSVLPRCIEAYQTGNWLIFFKFVFEREWNLCRLSFNHSADYGILRKCSSLQGSCGAMDNASDYGSEDSRFDSWQDRRFFLCHILVSTEEIWISFS
jgi:hypothetical protein